MRYVACGEPATIAVFLDGPEAPPTPMCTPHGTVYVEDGFLKTEDYRPEDPELTCGFVLRIEDD